MVFVGRLGDRTGQSSTDIALVPFFLPPFSLFSPFIHCSLFKAVHSSTVLDTRQSIHPPFSLFKVVHRPCAKPAPACVVFYLRRPLWRLAAGWFPRPRAPRGHRRCLPYMSPPAICGQLRVSLIPLNTEGLTRRLDGDIPILLTLYGTRQHVSRRPAPRRTSASVVSPVVSPTPV